MDYVTGLICLILFTVLAKALLAQVFHYPAPSTQPPEVAEAPNEEDHADRAYDAMRAGDYDRANRHLRQMKNKRIALRMMQTVRQLQGA